MDMKIIYSYLFLTFFLVPAAQAQDGPVSFTAQVHKARLKEADLIITAHIRKGVQLYALQADSATGPGTTIDFDTSAILYLEGPVQLMTPVTKLFDTTLAQLVSFHTDSAIWNQKLRRQTAGNKSFQVAIHYFYRQGDQYLSGEAKLKVNVPQERLADTATAHTEKEQSLAWIFIFAFGGGLLALLTPCVYSMIPITVSFFTKRSETRKQGIRYALYYALSIVLIFTLLGFLMTLIFGPAALNNLATNWIANLVFFALFVLFGFSFLGAFEITLPSSWAGRTGSKAGTKNFWGIFFMALTLVVVSFSCTGPIIGNLLVLASKGSYYGPLTGMFGFSLALSMPFALFAFFPSRLNVLGKAGGWLNAVKVTLGFLELALALKFLSNADLARNWRILDREIFIVLWMVLFGMLGLYLLGKISLRNDDELPKNDFGLPFLTVTRLVFAITAFSMVIYLFPGLFGAPLKGLGAFLPPMGTQDFNADDLPSGFDLGTLRQRAGASVETTHILPEPVKYAPVMKKSEPDVVVNSGLITYFDYEEALQIAREVKKPLMLDFTGINCVNCRKMEAQVWSDPGVMQLLKDSFVIASLFVDVHYGVELPEAEQYYSRALGKQVDNLGDKNADIQVTRFASNTQPYYFFLDSHQERLLPEGYGYNPDVQQFKNKLKEALLRYHQNKE